MPKISVLIPTYNTDPGFLSCALESIISQTFSDFEIIIIDDHSENERVENVINKYNDKRLKFYKNKENLGISATRNLLLEKASGEYIAIMDHDDISMPTRFEKQVEILDKNPNIGVVGTYYKNLPSGKIAKPVSNNSDIKKSLMRNCVILHPSSMIRKSVLTDNNISYRQEYSPAEDYALWCDLIKLTDFYNIPEVLFHYRNYSGNTSAKQKKKMEDARLAIHAKNQIEHPVFYQQFVLSATYTRRILLFGFLPIITIKNKGHRTKIYLLEFLLLASYKTQMRLKK